MELIATCPAHTQLSDVAAYAQRVEWLGFDVMHVSETIHDPFTVAALALASTERLVVRTSMVVAFPRSPMVTAYSAWDLSKFSRGRFQLGLASQVRGNIVGRFSTEWSEPVARLGDYVGAVRAIFDCFQQGGSLDYEGSHYRFTRLQPYFNPGPLDHSAPTIWTGGVNQKMCTLAGEVADGFVCHPTNSHPRLIDSAILPALVDGATRARRPVPRVVAGAQPLMAATQHELAAVREARRSELAFLYSTPAYLPQLEEFGLAETGRALSEMARVGNWDGLADILPDEVLQVLIPQGTYDEIPEVLDEWYAGRCDGIALVLPDSEEHDAVFPALVARCREVVTRSDQPAP